MIIPHKVNPNATKLHIIPALACRNPASDTTGCFRYMYPVIREGMIHKILNTNDNIPHTNEMTAKSSFLSETATS